MNITSVELKSLIDNNKSPILIDVREQYEFDEFNIGGKLLPLGDLPAKLPEIEKYKSDKIVMICRSGVRSRSAQDFLQKNGFSDVWNLDGGVLGWKEMQ